MSNEVVDAELVEPMAADAAARLDQRIRLLVSSIDNTLAKLSELVEEAKRCQIHQALGYSSWTAYVAEVFTVTTRLDPPQRRELVAYLSSEGMSQRSIADVVGANQATVSRDLSTDANASVEEDRESLGQDGRTRTYPRPEPKPVVAESDEVVDGKEYQRKPSSPPRRKPITDEFTVVSLKLRPLDRQIRKLLADDRIKRNRQALVGSCNDLIRFRDLLDEAINIVSLPASRDAK